MTAPLDTAVAIETPEHIVFQVRLAGPARRALAYLIDLVVCYGIVGILAVVVILALVGDRSASDLGSSAKAGGGSFCSRSLPRSGCTSSSSKP